MSTRDQDMKHLYAKHNHTPLLIARPKLVTYVATRTQDWAKDEEISQYSKKKNHKDEDEKHLFFHNVMKLVWSCSCIVCDVCLMYKDALRLRSIHHPIPLSLGALILLC